MPYLNWLERPIELTRTNHHRFGTQLELPLTSEDLARLREAVSEVILAGEGELRVDLPQDWTIFWKAREGESRQLLARPEKDKWVATLAYHSNEGRALINALTTKLSAPGNSIRLSELGPLNATSNIEVVIRLESGSVSD